LLGGVGGALNAALTDNLHLLPLVISVKSPDKQILHIGFVGSVCIGALAAGGTAAALAGTGCVTAAPGAGALTLATGAGVFLGFVTARWATNEIDKRLLHRAVCKASVAPAAHPDTVRAMETARPMAIFSAVDELTPRRVTLR
jgi:hypothetical protein